MVSLSKTPNPNCSRGAQAAFLRSPELKEGGSDGDSEGGEKVYLTEIRERESEEDSEGGGGTVRETVSEVGRQ